MMEVTKSIAPKTFPTFIGGGQIKNLYIAPQFTSSLRKELIFWPNQPDQPSVALQEAEQKMKEAEAREAEALRQIEMLRKQIEDLTLRSVT